MKRSAISMKGFAVGDARWSRRFAIALAASVALHEVIAGVWPRHEAPPPPETVVAERVTLTRRTPAPTPPPTPVPTPVITPAPHYTLAPVIVVRAPAARAIATPARHLGGAAAVKHVIHHTPLPVPPSAPPVSEVAGTHAGRQNGGSGTGAGPGAGTGGQGGTGSGTGTAGNGNGGDTNSGCGEVYLLPGDVTYRPSGVVLQQVLAKVVLRDGTVDVGKFPYPFVYSGEAQNPFRHDVGLARNGGIPVQMPPAGTDLTSLPESVAFVLKHTDPMTGFSNLPDCASSPSPG